jgi:fluoride exporter
MMKLLFLASAGGAIGAGLRHLINQAFAANGLVGVSHGVTLFPWATFSVNVIGSFLMGVVYVLVNERLGGSPEARTFLATGILGGLTTFSAFSLDILDLMTDSPGGAASPKVIAYVVGSVAMSFAALLAGIWMTRIGLGA